MIVESGPLKGFYRPDYDGGSLVDLMASVIRARGGTSIHAGLGSATEQSLASAHHVVLIVIDGLGLAQLDTYLATRDSSPFFARHRPRPLSSVFPATTAAAVTTIMTGASPAEHGILGWFLNLHDLGVVSTILPSTSRTEVPIVGERFSLSDYLAIPRPIESMSGQRVAFTHRFILESRFSRAASHWSETHTTETVAEMETKLLNATDCATSSYFYAYWPGYDGYSHQFGPSSPEAMRHLAEVDATLARLSETLVKRNAAVLVTADHGFVETPLENHIDLSQIESLYDSLATLPSGDARAVSLFVRPARLAELRQRLEAYEDVFTVVEGEALLEAAAFGPGEHHPSLYGRVGDLVLLAKGSYALSAPLRGRAPHRMPGNHGGMETAEMCIPLFALYP